MRSWKQTEADYVCLSCEDFHDVIGEMLKPAHASNKEKTALTAMIAYLTIKAECTLTIPHLKRLEI
jgi:hypothetical protein